MSDGAVDLVLDFCGERHVLKPGTAFSFGRAGDLVIDDDNRYLHRKVGVFEERSGTWWLRNCGRSIPLSVSDETSRSQAVVAPGREFALTYPSALIEFKAGRASYEFSVMVSSRRLPEDTFDLDRTSSSDTITLSDLPLTNDQKLLILALAETTLRDQLSTVDIPTNRQAAHRLGWKITKFNRKLDNVCDKLTKAGVGGLRGSQGSHATDRRAALVDYVVDAGIVTAADLELLPQA